MQKLFLKIFIFFFSWLLFSCNNEKENNLNTHQLKVTATKGIWQNPDSFAKPQTTPAGIPKPIPAGKPTVNPTNLNVHIAGTPKIIIAGLPKVNTPGTVTFLLPKTLNIICGCLFCASFKPAIGIIGALSPPIKSIAIVIFSFSVSFIIGFNISIAFSFKIFLTFSFS